MPPATVTRLEQEVIEREVLDVVGALVAELGGPASRGAVALDHALDRDLGIGSLERVELILRLDQAFGVRLPDAVMADAATPRDLAGAIVAAEPSRPETIPVPRRLSSGAAAPVPASARTLVDVLAWHADTSPDRVHIHLRTEDGQEQPITYRRLREGAGAVAAGLRTRGVAPGDAVALMLRSEEAFFDSFFGVLLAGGIPVPVYPPFRRDRIEEYARRQIGILDNAQVRALITFPEALRMAALLRSQVPTLRQVVTASALAQPGVTESIPGLQAGDPALIQYTSGSTGAPKGVLLTHANILANIRAIGEALALRPDDVAVSWLPLYHDMGLIGSWLGSLYFGIPIVILSPLAFLSRPARWLWAIHAHRGTVSAAPNFAFDLCVRKITDAEIQGLDLSAWRLALNGSEPVSVETIERFTRRFAPARVSAGDDVSGLRARRGLGGPDRPGPGRRAADRHRGARGVPAARAGVARCGGRSLTARWWAPAGRCRDMTCASWTEEGQPVGDRIEGRIEFRGPSVTSGYYRNPTATRAALREGWMDSGDLGYWAGQDLFVTGRRKDMIIKAGRNLYPQEVEEIVGAMAGIRKGCVAAFGVHDPTIGTERLVVIAESRETDPHRSRSSRPA